MRKAISVLLLFLPALLVAQVLTSYWEVKLRSQATGKLVPGKDVDLYQNGSKAYDLTESSTTPGVYYHNAVANGEYDIYVDGLSWKTGVWIGSNKLSIIADKFTSISSTGSSDTLKLAGQIQATTFIGDGSGLTGIASGTGGVTNAGSTTIGADTDLNGVGEIALQTKGATRMTVKNNGNVEIDMKYGGSMKAIQDEFDERGLNPANFVSVEAAIDTAVARGGHTLDLTQKFAIAAAARDTIPAAVTLRPVRGGGLQVTRKLRIEAAVVDPGPVQWVFGNIDSLEFAPGTTKFINVRWFGAKGDSATNDTPAFQAAIDAAGEANAPIYIPPGDYFVDSLLYVITDTSSLKQGIQVFGDGMNKSRIFKRDSSGSLLKFQGLDRETTDNFDGHLQNIKIHNLGLFGRGMGSGNNDGIYVRTWILFELKSVWIKGFGRHGIRLQRDNFVVGGRDDHALLTRVIGCQIEQNGSDGITSDGTFEPIDNILIENTQIADNGRDGFNLFVWYLTSQNNFIGGNGRYGHHTYKVSSSSNATMTVNLFNSVGEHNATANYRIESARTVTAVGCRSQQSDNSGTPKPVKSVWLGGTSSTNGTVGHVTWIGGVFDASVTGATAFAVEDYVEFVNIINPNYNGNITTQVDTTGANNAAITEQKDYRVRRYGTNAAYRYLAGAGETAIEFMEVTGSSPRFFITGDGVLRWAPDGATFDLALKRIAGDLLGTASGDEFRASAGLEVGDAGLNVVNANRAFYSTKVDVSYSASITIDASLGNVFSITLAGNVTSSSLINALANQRIEIHLIQDATGSRTFSWPVNMKFVGGSAPALTTTANSADIFTFTFDGSNWVETSRSMDVR